MKIVGTKMTVTVTAEGGEVYKNATLDYAEHFGSTAPAKREGGVVIGVNEQIVSFSNFEIKDGKDQYFADQVSGLISALPESEEIVFGDNRSCPRGVRSADGGAESSRGKSRKTDGG